MAVGEVEIWGFILLVAGSFVATNVDNLLLLVVVMGAEPRKRAAIALGFVSSAVCVLSVAALGAVLGANLDPELLGYLGLVPLLLGVYLLLKQWRTKAPAQEPDDTLLASPGSGWLTAFLLMFSNSGDSLAVFFPLLAESERDSLLLIISVFLSMALLWTALAWSIADQPRLARRIEQVGEKLMPWMMMAVGIYILMDTATDTVY